VGRNLGKKAGGFKHVPIGGVKAQEKKEKSGVAVDRGSTPVGEGKGRKYSKTFDSPGQCGGGGRGKTKRN